MRLFKIKNFPYTVEAMELLTKTLQNKPIFYVTRDLERAIGLSLGTPGYFIISNFTAFGKKVAQDSQNVLLIENFELLDTVDLLNHPQTKEFIQKHNTSNSQANILVFKNIKLIEKICLENNWNLLNPKADLSQKVEEKISQVEWLGELSQFLPPHIIKPAKEVTFDGTPFILQFNRAHTGLGTMLIESEHQLQEIQTKFPERPVRVTQFIEGPMFTSNNVVAKNKIMIGNMSYQITGIVPFTQNTFATVGNDWRLPQTILTDAHRSQYVQIVTAVGNKLRESGWKGLFGVDIILDEKNQKLYLIEINARQPASTTYESQLQANQQSAISNLSTNETVELTTFEAHLATLLDLNLDDYELIEINDGAQIIMRVSDQQISNQQSVIENLKNLNLDLNLIDYDNTALGSDCIRIQSQNNFMSKHGQLNETGNKIAKAISL